jgi:integrase
MREANARKAWVAGELAAMRVPDVSILAERPAAPTLAEAAERWRSSRVDVARNTYLQHRSAVGLLSSLHARAIDTIEPQDVADLVADLHAASKAKETIRKTLVVLAMIFDHAGISPNPARDKVKIKLPREESEEPNPPTAEHVEAVYRLLPSKHRLALLWLDYSGARVGSVDETLVGDYDEPRRRVRLRKAVTKTKKPLWVDLPDVLADAIEASIGPREDRDLSARLFAGSGADALRTSLARACKAAGVPLFTPHDLRHRKVSVMHAQGKTWAHIGAFVGQKDLSTTANTYTHVMLDATEVDYPTLIG